MLDTETIAISTFVEACKEYGFQPDMSVYHKCIGVDWSTTKKILSKGYGNTFALEPITNLWKEKMDHEMLVKPIRTKKGALKLLTYLEEEGVKVALVTSTRTEIAQRALYNAKMDCFFLFIIGGDQVSKNKPNPEIYLTACHKLSEEPIKCLALEDSDNGVLAAFHAGLEVIQVPDLVPPSMEVKTLGHKIVESLEEVENLLK